MIDYILISPPCTEHLYKEKTVLHPLALQSLNVRVNLRLLERFSANQV